MPVFYPAFWIILAAAAVACCIGFKKYIWFISIGYGLSISAVGICLLCIYPAQLAEPVKLIAALLLILYGFRLGGYLAYRELKSASYNKKMVGEISDGSHMTLPLKIMLWLSCVVLYVFMTSPIIYRFANDLPTDTCFIVGLIIMFCGVVLESASDLSKNKQKKVNPRRFCDKGLFRIVRCPNYFGEMVIWTGVLVSGITALKGAQWVIAVIGYLGIIYIMFSGARRLELRQDRTYGSDPEYQEYVKTVPILVPLIPLYSVKKHKWLVG